MKTLYKKIMLTAAVLLVVCSVFLGSHAYKVERDTIVNVFEGETKAAAASVDSMFEAMTRTFEDEVSQMEAFLSESERADDEITEYLRQRTRWISTTVNAIYIDLFCVRRGNYMCGNYWHPPKSIDFTKRPWYLAAVEANGKTAIIPPYKPNDYPFQLIAVSRKLNYPDTVLSLDVQLSDFEPIVSETHSGKSGYSFFFAPDGSAITPANESTFYKYDLTKVFEEVKRNSNNGNLGSGKEEKSNSNSPFLLGDDFVFYSFSHNGWCVVSLHNSNDITVPARWAVLKPFPWLLLGFFIVYLIAELLRYKSDFRDKSEVTMPIRGNKTQFVVFLLAVVSFFSFVWLGERQVMKVENRLAVMDAETTIRNAVTPLVAFIETARGAAGYCSQHFSRLLREGADLKAIEAETKEIVGIYRSLPNRNYRSIFVTRPNWYVDSMGWKTPHDYKVAEHDFYRLAINNPTGIVFTPPYTSAIDGSVVVTAARAIGDDEGTVVGLDIPLKMLQTLVRGIRLEGAQCAMLISQDGFIINHRHLRTLSDGEDMHDVKAIASRALQEAGSFQYVNASGKMMQAVSVPLSIGGRAIVIGDERMLKTALSSYRGRTMAVIVVIFIVAIFIGFLSLRRIRSQRERDIVAIERARQADQLQEALAMAQSASRAKTTFLNNMSHDIRTPMNAIIGFTGLAASHIDNKGQVQDYLRKIGQASNHLLSLINDVLDMSRIESGKMNMDEKEENLPAIIHTLRDIVQADIRAKQHEFFIDTVNVNDENIVCDKLRLNQVLLNILSNAIKYTANGGIISMRITEKAVKSSGYATYEFCIKDNGMGMEPEYLKTIYDPFTRVKSSTVSGIQGTGLGMAITKNIIDMMGGTIDVQSAPGKGTQMTVTFDFKLLTAHKESTAITELSGLRGLVVDDDADTCMSVAGMLRDIGMRDEWCVSGKEAVLRAAEACRIGDHFKVYIIDWLMPDMNGIETTRRIRKVIGEDVPIIILTAYDWSDIEDEAREAGVTAFVSKPMFPSDLQRVLNDCLGKHEAAESRHEEEFDFSGKKILLVEDNELNREIAEEFLTENGVVVDTAADGTIAVEKMKNAKENDYDAVLMDVQMPVMNGYEATKAIRALGTPVSRIPIIAMTADAFAEDRKLALESGMNDHITKPINIKILKQTLAKYV